MMRYVAFVLTRQGQIIKAVDLNCPNDEDAKGQAQQLVDGHAVELWEGTTARRVALLPPTPGDGDAVALRVKQPRLSQAARSTTSRKTAL